MKRPNVIRGVFNADWHGFDPVKEPISVAFRRKRFGYLFPGFVSQPLPERRIILKADNGLSHRLDVEIGYDSSGIVLDEFRCTTGPRKGNNGDSEGHRLHVDEREGVFP